MYNPCEWTSIILVNNEEKPFTNRKRDHRREAMN